MIGCPHFGEVEILYIRLCAQSKCCPRISERVPWAAAVAAALGCYTAERGALPTHRGKGRPTHPICNARGESASLTRRGGSCLSVPPIDQSLYLYWWHPHHPTTATQHWAPPLSQELCARRLCGSPPSVVHQLSPRGGGAPPQLAALLPLCRPIKDAEIMDHASASFFGGYPLTTSVQPIQVQASHDRMVRRHNREIAGVYLH